MTESEIIKSLQTRLSAQIMACEDVRTLLRVLELLSDEPIPKGYNVQEPGKPAADVSKTSGYEQEADPSVAEEPPVPYGLHSDLLSPAQLREVNKRHEDLMAGRGKSYTWDEVLGRLSDIL